MPKVLPCCWSSRTSCRASRSRTAPTFSKTAPSCYKAARLKFATILSSNALISDCDDGGTGQAGFRTLYVSGAAIAYTRLGQSDVGLVGMSEVVEVVASIGDRVAADLI